MASWITLHLTSTHRSIRRFLKSFTSLLLNWGSWLLGDYKSGVMKHGGWLHSALARGISSDISDEVWCMIYTTEYRGLGETCMSWYLVRWTASLWPPFLAVSAPPATHFIQHVCVPATTIPPSAIHVFAAYSVMCQVFPLSSLYPLPKIHPVACMNCYFFNVEHKTCTKRQGFNYCIDQFF